ncbi:MAG: isoprenylcysteine carboxylmethyltransferase family protein [Pedobacter sp.]
MLPQAGMLLIVYAVLHIVFQRLSSFEKSYIYKRIVAGVICEKWSLKSFKFAKKTVLVLASIEYTYFPTLVPVEFKVLTFAFFVIGIWLRISAITALGTLWSYHVEIREHHEVIRTGIYRYVKHPAYIGNIFIPAICFLIGSLYTSALALIFICTFYIYRSNREEYFLCRSRLDSVTA